MAIDLKEIMEFFENYQERPMPRSVIDAIMSGKTLEFGDLRTNAIEWRSIRDIFSPEIARKIDVPCEGYNIPVLRKMPTPEHFVYEPRTGEYLGQFNVKPLNCKINI